MAEQKPIISIDHVSMRFNLSKEKHESLKEYFLSLIHISEPTRRTPISYAVFCLKKKNKKSVAIASIKGL